MNPGLWKSPWDRPGQGPVGWLVSVVETSTPGKMKPELLEQLQHHKGLAKTKAETEESLLALRKREEEEYLLARNNIIMYLLKPAWAKAIAQLGEADFIMEELPASGGEREEWNLSIASPHSSKPAKRVTLGFDELNCYVYLDGKERNKKYLAQHAGVEGLVEMIVEVSITDLGPFAISLPSELYKSKYPPLPEFMLSLGNGPSGTDKQLAGKPGSRTA